jgi:uncharacterized membrane protein
MHPAGLTGILKLIHIIAAIAWVGGAVFLTVYGFGLRKAGSPKRIAFAEQEIVAGRLFAGFAAVALAAGVWLVAREPLWGFDQAWIHLGFGGIALGAILGPSFYAPQARAFIAELEAGEAAAADARASRIGMVSVVEALVLLVVLWAMVYKPGGPF